MTGAIILGLGGHARVVADVALVAGWQIAGFVGPREDARTLALFAAPYLGDDAVLATRDSAEMLLNGLGSLAPGSHRVSLYRELCSRGWRFATLVHPAAVVAASARLGGGAQIHAGAVVQPGCVIGENTILNTRCSVDHDCQVAAHCHIAPGAVLSGGVRLGEDVHVGSGAVVIQGIEIGAGAMIAAGAVVTKNVDAATRVAGVPARKF